MVPDEAAVAAWTAVAGPMAIARSVVGRGDNKGPETLALTLLASLFGRLTEGRVGGEAGRIFALGAAGEGGLGFAP